MCSTARNSTRERVSGGQPLKTLHSLKASLAGVICVLTLPRVPEGLLCAACGLAQAYKAVPMK